MREVRQNMISSSKSILLGATKYSNKGSNVSSTTCRKLAAKYSCSAINLIVFQHLFILILALSLITFFLDVIFAVPPFKLKVFFYLAAGSF